MTRTRAGTLRAGRGDDLALRIAQRDGEPDLLLETLQPHLQHGGIAGTGDHVFDHVLRELQVGRRAAAFRPVEIADDRQGGGERGHLREADEVDAEDQSGTFHVEAASM